MILDIIKETDEQYEAVVFWFGDPSGVSVESIKKTQVENERFVSKEGLILRTKIL